MGVGVTVFESEVGDSFGCFGADRSHAACQPLANPVFPTKSALRMIGVSAVFPSVNDDGSSSISQRHAPGCTAIVREKRTVSFAAW